MINQIFENLFKPITDKESLDRMSEYFPFMDVLDKFIQAGNDNGSAMNNADFQYDEHTQTTIHWPYIGRIVCNLLRSDRPVDYSNYPDEVQFVAEYKTWRAKQ